jgi:hypothetical protein
MAGASGRLIAVQKSLPAIFVATCNIDFADISQLLVLPSRADGAPGRTRTCDPRLRRPMLYPAELRAQAFR